MQDFLINITTGDLSILLGDLDIGNSDAQHQNDLLLADKGSLKAFMDAGVGIMKYVEGENADNLLLEIRRQFSSDGMNVKRIQYNEQTGQLLIDASYNAI